MIYSPFRNIELCKVCTASTLLGMLKKKTNSRNRSHGQASLKKSGKKGKPELQLLRIHHDFGSSSKMLHKGIRIST